MSGEPILRVRDVCVRFGGVVALDGVSFDVRRGEICGLIGPNGAGKTTLFNCVSGLCPPASGELRFRGVPLSGLAPDRIARLGIGRTFQNLALFPTLTVRQNVMVGAHARRGSGIVADALRLPSAGREEARLNMEIDELLDFMDLREIAGMRADALSLGTRKNVELARALASRPELLLLDEPAGGLNHAEVERLSGRILSIRDEFGIAVLLVEHHMNLVMRVSDRVVVLDFGRRIAEGAPGDVQNDPAVIRAYLGAAA